MSRVTWDRGRDGLGAWQFAMFRWFDKNCFYQKSTYLTVTYEEPTKSIHCRARPRHHHTTA